MIITTASKTDTGRVRPHNEDYLWVNPEAGAYIVADGLGGREAGELASRLAAVTVGQLMVEAVQASRWPPTITTIRTIMTDAIETANERLQSVAQIAHQQHHMATTLIAALVRPPYVYICHAGDTRAYLARDNELLRLTEDDTLVARMVAAGVLSIDAMATHPHSHIVTRVVGQPDPVQPSFQEVLLLPGDWLLLCTDGLWSMLEDSVILELLLQSQHNPAQAVDSLVAAANAAGGTDNVSVIALHSEAQRRE
jgi:protein phosphatase